MTAEQALILIDLVSDIKSLLVVIFFFLALSTGITIGHYIIYRIRG